MKTFHLSCRVTVSACTTVEAESADQAKDIAETRSVALPGHGDVDNCWLIDEADGEPKDIAIEE